MDCPTAHHRAFLERKKVNRKLPLRASDPEENPMFSWILSAIEQFSAFLLNKANFSFPVGISRNAHATETFAHNERLEIPG
jgi:hypothetical protein